jgi:hypothetical protein
MKRKLFLLSLAVVLCFSVSGVQAAYISLLGLGVDVSFTPVSGLSFDSWAWNPDFLALSDPAFTNEPSETVPGLVDGLQFGNFSGILNNEPGQTAGTFVFAVDAGVPGGTVFDLSMALPSFATDSTVAPALNGASVNVVPIPAAAWLLGSGLLALVGLRRKLS